MFRGNDKAKSSFGTLRRNLPFFVHLYLNEGVFHELFKQKV